MTTTDFWVIAPTIHLTFFGMFFWHGKQPAGRSEIAVFTIASVIAVARWRVALRT